MHVSNNDLNKKQLEFEWKNYGVFVSFPVKSSPIMIEIETLLNLFMQFTGFSLYDTSKEKCLTPSTPTIRKNE